MRSQFLADFSFFAFSDLLAGTQPIGGHRLRATECNWVYTDAACRSPRPCRIVSPGFPGIYPPHLVCSYMIVNDSPGTRVQLNFSALALPPDHCDTHFVAIHAGPSSVSGRPKRIVCGDRRPTSDQLVFDGPSVQVVFRTGAQVSPFNFNGFAATLTFVGGAERDRKRGNRRDRHRNETLQQGGNWDRGRESVAMTPPPQSTRTTTRRPTWTTASATDRCARDPENVAPATQRPPVMTASSETDEMGECDVDGSTLSGSRSQMSLNVSLNGDTPAFCSVNISR